MLKQVLQQTRSKAQPESETESYVLWLGPKTKAYLGKALKRGRVSAGSGIGFGASTC